MTIMTPTKKLKVKIPKGYVPVNSELIIGKETIMIINLKKININGTGIITIREKLND